MRIIATFSRSTDFPTDNFTGAGEGTSLCAGLDDSGAAGITRIGFSICSRSWCPRESRAASAPCPVRSKNSLRARTKCKRCEDNRLSLRGTHCPIERANGRNAAPWAGARTSVSIWKPARKRCSFSTSCAPNIPTTHVCINISVSITTRAISRWNSRSRGRAAAIPGARDHVSKIHFSSALKVRPTPRRGQALRPLLMTFIFIK